MRRLIPVLGVLLIGLCLAAPIAIGCFENAQAVNFHIVRDSVLYRCAQPSLYGLQRIIHDHGIRTVVNLREGIQPNDVEEEEFCEREEINFVRIRPLSWDGVRGSAPVDAGIDRFLAVMRDPKNHPVLVHCCAGIHRTGAYVAVYRMELEGWSNDRAIAEMKAHGYSTFDEEDDIHGYLTTYRPCCLSFAPRPQARRAPAWSRRGRFAGCRLTLHRPR
jgi:tyrosine-protein phosphatase SIW14